MTTTMGKLRGLIETLYNQTMDGKVKWATGFDKSTVSSNITDYQVELSEESSSGFENDIRCTIYDSGGDQIDTFTDTYFKGYQPSILGISSYYYLMQTLLEAARRQASGADAAIESLLKALGGSPVQEAIPTIHDDDDVPF